jgi:hypothetical protein
LCRQNGLTYRKQFEKCGRALKRLNAAWTAATTTDRVIKPIPPAMRRGMPHSGRLYQPLDMAVNKRKTTSGSAEEAHHAGVVGCPGGEPRQLTDSSRGP